MSKIALQGDASGTGTFTIAAPNSNSNPTLTLPTSSGTVVVTGGAQTIEFAAGTAAAPSITFTGDTNTGIFSPGADSIGFAEGGAEIARFDSSGNFGIGTSSPSSFGKLAIRGGITVNAGTTSITGTGFSTSDAINSTFFINHTSGCVNLIADTALTFWGASGSGVAERMRIDSSGNVLINTTANAGNAKLKSKVSAGSFGLEVTDESQSDFVVAPLSGAVCRVGPTAGAMAFYTANTERMRINSSGQVGIGTNNPTDRLTVSDGTTNVAVNPTGGIFYFGPTTNHPTVFITNNSERARITSDGDLCVGTTATSSSARLNVRRESLTSTTKAANTIAKFGPGTGTSRDANIICSDYTSYDYFFGGRGGVAYVTVNNNQGVQLSAGGTSWSSDSDESLKDIIEPITNAVATVGQWRTVIGKYKTDEADKRRVFFIAQDFQTSLPEAVDESPEGTLLLRYQDAIPVLAAAIKELKAITDAQATRIEALEAEVAALKGQ